MPKNKDKMRSPTPDDTTFEIKRGDIVYVDTHMQEGTVVHIEQEPGIDGAKIYYIKYKNGDVRHLTADHIAKTKDARHNTD